MPGNCPASRASVSHAKLFEKGARNEDAQSWQPLALCICASAAAACPDPTSGGLGQFTADRTTLSRGISFSAIGGGTHDLSRCTVPGAGYFLASPHMTLTLDNVARASGFHRDQHRNGVVIR